MEGKTHTLVSGPCCLVPEGPCCVQCTGLQTVPTWMSGEQGFGFQILCLFQLELSPLLFICNSQPRGQLKANFRELGTSSCKPASPDSCPRAWSNTSPFYNLHFPCTGSASENFTLFSLSLCQTMVASYCSLNVHGGEIKETGVLHFL